jgi:hypothetical protein
MLWRQNLKEYENIKIMLLFEMVIYRIYATQKVLFSYYFILGGDEKPVKHSTEIDLSDINTLRERST